MTPTAKQRAKLEIALATNQGSARIAQKLGLPLDVVTAARAERQRRIRCEEALRDRQRRAALSRLKSDKSREHVRDSGVGLVDDGALLTALRAHMPPLTSLPERVASLGRCVSLRIAA